MAAAPRDPARRYDPPCAEEWRDWGPGDRQDAVEFYLAHVAGRAVSVIDATRAYVATRLHADAAYAARFQRRAAALGLTSGELRDRVARRLALHIVGWSPAPRRTRQEVEP